MRSVQARFNKAKEKDKDNHYSSFIYFVRAIKGQDFKEGTIKKWFYELVDKEDHVGQPKTELLRWLYDI